MPLKVELKPGERFILGEYIIVSSERTRLTFINDDVTLLREKDYLAPDQAGTPARRIYLSLQTMYTSGDADEHRKAYRELAGSFVKAFPSARRIFDEIDSFASNRRQLYKALQSAKKLIAYEDQILQHHG